MATNTITHNTQRLFRRDVELLSETSQYKFSRQDFHGDGWIELLLLDGRIRFMDTSNKLSGDFPIMVIIFIFRRLVRSANVFIR